MRRLISVVVLTVLAAVPGVHAATTVQVTYFGHTSSACNWDETRPVTGGPISGTCERPATPANPSLGSSSAATNSDPSGHLGVSLKAANGDGYDNWHARADAEVWGDVGLPVAASAADITIQYAMGPFSLSQTTVWPSGTPAGDGSNSAGWIEVLTVQGPGSQSPTCSDGSQVQGLGSSALAVPAGPVPKGPLVLHLTCAGNALLSAQTFRALLVTTGEADSSALGSASAVAYGRLASVVLTWQ